MSYKHRAVFAFVLIGSLALAGAPRTLADDGATPAAAMIERLVAWGESLWAQLVEDPAATVETTTSPDPEGEPGPEVIGYIDPRG